MANWLSIQAAAEKYGVTEGESVNGFGSII